MHWNWKESIAKNSLKTGSHILLEASILGAWYIALEGDPTFWIFGILSAFALHVGMFNVIDFFHDHHTHRNKKTSIFIAEVMSMDCRDGKHFSCTYGKGCNCICHHPDT